MPRRAPSRSRPRIAVLRLGHRAGRDPRLTTHLALTARAFGAERLMVEPPDRELADRVQGIAAAWGGGFRLEGVRDWRAALRAAPGPVVHLTMYGLPLDRVLPRLRRARDLLVVVGGAKVPPDLYRLATYNVAVGAQPHSEVAALAVLLDRLGGIPPPASFAGARHRIVPTAHGKRMRASAGRSEGG